MKSLCGAKGGLSALLQGNLVLFTSPVSHLSLHLYCIRISPATLLAKSVFLKPLRQYDKNEYKYTHTRQKGSKNNTLTAFPITFKASYCILNKLFCH